MRDSHWVTPVDMKSYYVYAYFDENGQPFYIGKGKGYRINNHVKPSLLTDKSYKNHKIKSLLEKQGYVKRDILSYFHSEDSAYSFEEYLISYYGIYTEGGLLTNHCKCRDDIPDKVKLSARKSKESIGSRLDHQNIINLHRLWVLGEITVAEASIKLGVSSGYLSGVFRGEKMKYLNLIGKPTALYKKHKLSKHSQVLSLYDEGLSYDLISSKTGVPKTSVARIVKSKGSGNGTSDNVAGQDNSTDNLENS